MTSGVDVRFDGWTLNRGTGELSRGGVRVRLQSQPQQVLEALLERPGEMVSREQLIARLWPRGVVDFDTALNSAVRRLRIALDDHADAPRYIETIPKRGYRFLLAVERAPVEDPPGSVQRASMPPETDERQAIPVVRRDRTLPGRAWLAAACVVALVGALGARTLTSSSSPDSPRPRAAQVTGENAAAARDRYLQGRFLLHRRVGDDVARARSHFLATLRLDPHHARAWAGIASSWWLDAVEGRADREVAFTRAVQAADQALRIDSTIAEAHLRLGNIARWRGDDATGDARFREALRLEPDDPLVLVIAASNAASERRWPEAISLQRRAVTADPLAAATRYNLAVMLYAGGSFAESKSELLAVQELRQDSSDQFMRILAQVLVLNGEAEDALAASERIDDEASRLQARVLALHALGRHAESDAALARLRQVPSTSGAYLLVEAHAFRGEIEPALQALAGIPPGGLCADGPCWPVEWLPSLPLLQPLRNDARWNAWLASQSASAS